MRRDDESARHRPLIAALAALPRILPWMLAGGLMGLVLTPSVEPPGFSAGPTILGAVIGAVAGMIVP